MRPQDERGENLAESLGVHSFWVNPSPSEWEELEALSEGWCGWSGVAEVKAEEEVGM